MKARVAVVEWMDAWERPGVSTLTDWKHGGYPTCSVGWIVKEDETGISLCQEWWPGATEDMRNANFIPRGMVKKVTYMRGPPPRRKGKRVAKTSRNS